MFGYVRAYKPQMTFAQYDIYKGVYCSVCKQIGKRYGLIARCTLSYDITFFALFRLALKNDCVKFHKSHCSFNPLKKCPGCDKDNNEIQYAADVSMLMVYYKFIDNVNDSKGIKRFLYKLLTPYFKRIRKKALKFCPEADEILSSMTRAQSEAEKAGADIDRAAHPSADALGKLASLNIERADKEKIYRFGYMTGRWVYLADASDDYDDDKKSGSFNPLIKYEKDEAVEKAKAAMHLTLGELTDIFDSIQFNCIKPVLANIINDGMYKTINDLSENREEKT